MIHESTLAWKIPRMEELGRQQSMGSLRVRQDWVTSLSLFTFMHWRRKWQPTPVFLPGECQGWGEPGGLLSMGSNRVRHDWSDLAAAAAAAAAMIHEKMAKAIGKWGDWRREEITGGRGQCSIGQSGQASVRSEIWLKYRTTEPTYKREANSETQRIDVVA